MTREEAIEILEANRPDLCYQMLREAVDFAVDALKAQIDKDINVPNTDCIYRQAAIDAIDDYLDEYSGLDEEGYHGEKWCAMAEAKMVIENLPSAQPEIVYCKDCICGHGEVWLSGNGSADLYGYCGRTQLRVLPYDYCSYAKRRTDGSD